MEDDDVDLDELDSFARHLGMDPATEQVHFSPCHSVLARVV